jgi:enoyl-CoA hydratase/carnithine racemase
VTAGPDAVAEPEGAPDLPAFRWLRLSRPAAHVVTVTLNRPPVNALDSALRSELLTALDVLQEAATAHAIVLSAAGHVFSAGADLKEKEALAGPAARAAVARLARETFFAVVSSGRPVIAAVEGPALGAGFVLAACCDLIVAGQDAVFGMPEIDVGQAGGASFLQRILPQQAMRAMMLTADRVPAAELHRLGAVHRLVAPGQAEDAAVAIAARIAAKSPAAVKAIRASFAPVAALPLREGFALEQGYIDELSACAAGSAARRAFLAARSQRAPSPSPSPSPSEETEA